MADQIPFDKLRYIDCLTNAGTDRAQARVRAEAIENALRESVATKTDITEVKHAIERAVRDMTIRTGAVGAAVLVILAAIKFFG
jgi:hypothetical protein